MIARNFVIDYALAKAQGVSQSEALKFALVASPFRPVFGMIVAFALAREETPRPAPATQGVYPWPPPGYARGLFRRRIVAAPVPPVTMAPSPSVSPGLQQLQQAVATAGLPSFQGMDKLQVETWAQILNLTPVFEGPNATGKVEWQEPGPGKPPKDNTLKLKLK